MLQSVHPIVSEKGAAYSIGEASFPVPFASQLEYNSPAHGPWNIVHIGMLIPGSHEIYCCTGNCNRGVILTAAEMGQTHRYSNIVIKEDNILAGNMEDLLIDGVCDILDHLEKLPPAVLLFPSCIHQFMGSDIPMVYDVLRNKYPEILFIEGFMDCILQKGGITPDQRLRRELYSGLKKCPVNPRSVNIIGNTLKLDPESDLARMLEEGGFTLRQLPDCQEFEDYLAMSESCLNISLLPVAGLAAARLKDRLDMDHLYLPECFGYEENTSHLKMLSEKLGLPMPDVAGRIAECEQALKELKELIGDTPIAIDYNAIPRPCGLARLLLEHDMKVVRIYADAFVPEEEADFRWLQEHAPWIKVYATIHVKMRVLDRSYPEKLLAVGQKAAYFTNSPYFVNMVEGGGFQGFTGILKMVALMKEAYLQEKDIEDLIVRKGLGNPSLISI